MIFVYWPPRTNRISAILSKHLSEDSSGRVVRPVLARDLVNSAFFCHHWPSVCARLFFIRSHNCVFFLSKNTSFLPPNTAPVLGLDLSGIGPFAERSPDNACPRWTPSASAQPRGHALSPPDCRQAGSTASPSPGFAGGDIRGLIETI